MINTKLLQPSNLAFIAIVSVSAIYFFNKFQSKLEA